MGQRLALIIGNSLYLDGALSRLLTPNADVGALGEILLEPELGGFDDANVLLNMSSHIIRRAIASFFSKRAREDLLLLYFSGHGVLDDQGHLYLAVRDTDSKLLRGTAISASYITDEMNNSRSQRQVLVLDCCHSGAFARGTKGQPGASVGTASAFEGTGFGRVVLTASDATQYAWEGEQVIGEAENSLFTHYVLQGIKSGEADLNGDGQITIDELYDYVYERVVRQTPKQTPGKWSYKERGEIIVSRAPGKAPEVKVTVSLPEFERDVEEKLEKLYNEGLSAYWLEDWDKAVRCFQAILEARPDYPEAANKLELSRRKKQLRSLYERALAAEAAGDWPGVIASLGELLAIEPAYQDAPARLEHAKRSWLLADLYVEARQLSQAGKWQAVVNVFAQIASLTPDYPDPEGLLAAARVNVAELERLTNLERKYSQALREMDAGRWSQAEGLLAEVQELEPGYQAAERLLERARREVARQQEARQLEEQVNTLYQQAIGLRRARHWRKALEKMEEIRVLSPEFKDTEGVSLQAQAEIEREEGEAQRQKQLAEKYAAAVRSLEAGQYQQALERWNEVQSLDPSYPDPQKVLKTARKKLKELSQAEAPQPRLSRQRIALYALGGVVLLGVVIFLGIRGYGGGWPEKATPPPAGLAAVATKNLTPPSTQGPTTPLPAGLSAATTNKPTTTAGLVAVATKKPNPTATRKPTTRPPTATALQMVFDDFENTQFDRAYNEAIWGNEGRNDPKIGTVTQQDGILVFTSEGKDKGMGLFLDQVWGYALDSATVLEGRLSVDKSSYGAHLGIFIEFAEGYAECQIQAWSEDYIHCWADFFGKNYDLPVRVITPGTWHKVRIEISDLDPITFDYYADDKHLGQIIPERAGMISKRLTGVQFHLISYAEKLNYGYVDDVYFGPPR